MATAVHTAGIGSQYAPGGKDEYTEWNRPALDGREREHRESQANQQRRDQIHHVAPWGRSRPGMVDEHERGHRRQTNAQGHPRAAQDQPIELYAQCRLFVGGRASGSNLPQSRCEMGARRRRHHALHTPVVGHMGSGGTEGRPANAQFSAR
jgi:hypothetical protein